jgi:hypothetical protein
MHEEVTAGHVGMKQLHLPTLSPLMFTEHHFLGFVLPTK